jgi:hypothetical protein
VTATVVNGLKVIEDEPTRAPKMVDNAGQPLFWKRTRTLLLEDGSTIFGCSDCEFVHANMYAIRPHLTAHIDPAKKRKRGPKKQPARLDDINGMSLSDLLAQVQTLQSVQDERDAWRTRAQAAERSLNVLRKALT